MSRSVLLRRRFTHATAALSVLAAAACLVGFVRISFNPGSPAFKWSTTTVKYVINDKGSDDITGDDSESAAIRLGFRAWEQISDSVIRFEEDTSLNTARTDFNANDVHMVIFDEDGSTGFFPAGSNIIALTPLTASTLDGTILDADILFNGKLKFTTEPGQDTSRFDVQAIVTHEIGHFIGLDHSGGPKATMFTTIPGGTIYARSLCRDDEAAAATIYASGANGRGTIQGTVSQSGGGGLAFAQVVALTNPGGEYAGQALANSAGTYRIDGLLPGSYDLYVEPANGPFLLTDTIAFKSSTASSFRTTYAPTNPITLTAGQTVGLSWAAQASPTLNVSSFTGGRVQIGSSGSITLGGAGLGSVNSVKVSGSGVTVESFNSPTAASMTVTLSANAGTAATIRSLELKNASGEIAILSAAVDVVTAPPSLSSVSPTLLLASGGQSVTVNGAGFVSGSQVVIGGKLAQSVTVSGATQLSCISPSSPGISGAVDVVVIRPDGQEARLSGAVTYEASPIPTSVDPPSGPRVGGTTHTVRGTGFAAPATVTVGDQTAEVVSVSAEAIQIVLPPSQATGVVDVSVTVSNKTGTLSSGFTYIDGTPPVVTSLAPTSGPTSGGNSITIVGSGFDANAQVTFDGLQATVSAASTTQLVVVNPAHAVGAVEVRVTNPTSGLATLAGTFTYTDTPTGGGGGGGGGGGCALDTSELAPSPLASWLLALGVLGLLSLRRLRA